MTRKAISALAVAMALGGCLDADVTMDFSDGDTMQADVRIEMARQLFDMTGQSPEEFCSEGTHQLTSDKLICQTSRKVTIEELLAENGSVGPDSQFNPGEAAVVERIGDDKLRITFDFAGAMADQDQSTEDLGGAEAMIRAAMAGYDFTLRVRAPEIISTNGTLSEDGTQAEYIIPVVRFLDRPLDLGAPFVTEIDLSPSCFLWVFCG